MKVVKVIYQSYYPQQGRYPRVSGQAGILIRGGHQVTVLACDRDGGRPAVETLDGVPVERLPVLAGEMRGPLRQWLPLLIFYVKALSWFKRRDVDLLHCHNLDVLPLGWIVKKLKKCKLVFEAHEPNYYALWPKALRPLVRVVDGLDAFLARRCDAVSVTNLYQVKKYRELGVPRVELMGNYPAPQLRITTLDEAKFRQDKLVLGRFGTFYPDVGLEQTLDAYGRLLSRRPGRVKLILGGRVVDAYRATFLKLTQPFGDAVEYVGPYNAAEMPALYARVHVSCLIYPRSEWFRNITPRKFFDSLANGVPVLITDIGGLGEVVMERGCGIVVDERDPESAAVALQSLVDDRQRVLSLARRALDLANTEYSWPALEQKYNRLAEDLCPGR